MTKKTTHIDRLGIERKNPVINRVAQKQFRALIKRYAAGLAKADFEAFKTWSRDEWPLLRKWSGSNTGIEVGTTLMLKRIEALALADMRCG